MKLLKLMYLFRENISTTGHHPYAITLPMLRLLMSKAHGPKDFGNSSKPYHVGIHWKDLAEYSRVSTHVPRV